MESAAGRLAQDQHRCFGTSSGASGVVIRNSQGEVVLAAAARANTNVADVTMAEALAARDGVLLATEQGATKGDTGGG